MKDHKLAKKSISGNPLVWCGLRRFPDSPSPAESQVPLINATETERLTDFILDLGEIPFILPITFDKGFSGLEYSRIEYFDILFKTKQPLKAIYRERRDMFYKLPVSNNIQIVPINMEIIT